LLHPTSAQLIEVGDQDFAKHLSLGPLTQAQIRTYWMQMLEAVQFIHVRAHLVHTDLKPANFLLVGARLKLIDFGIAQKIPLGTVHISRDQIIGTPNYMAPETILCARGQGGVYKVSVVGHAPPPPHICPSMRGAPKLMRA
jgi:serine/threonine protein kinase